MTDISCNYDGDREQTLIAYLYDEVAPADRAAFDAHLDGCGRCRRDLASLAGVRQQLARWQPPEPQLPTLNSQLSSAGDHPPVAGGQAPWWQQVPAWAQVAAALLFLGVAAGIANLDVRYDASGVTVRTGWSKALQAPAAPSVAAAPAADTATREDLTALARQLRSEIRAVEPAAQPARAAQSADADAVRRVRALIDESEKRQQRELALRIAQVLRDVGLQRQADLSKIDRNLGLIQNTTGVEILKQREMVNYLMRVSQKQ